MKTELITYLTDRFPQNFIIKNNSYNSISIRDSNAYVGKGYNIEIIEENHYIEAKIEFEDYAKEIAAYAQNKLSDSDNELKTLFVKNEDLYAIRYNYTAERLFETGILKDNGWSIKIGYRKNKKYSTENFVDLLLSTLLFIFPYDINVEEEGMTHSANSTVYERSLLNRAFCIAFHGFTCMACGESLREKYGDVARKFIEVHHLIPVSNAGINKPDPINDMVPLCPNCHSIVHLKTPPYTIEELKSMLNRNDEKL